MSEKIWIVGCGDIGRRVAHLYKNENIQGIIQSQTSANLCESSGIKPFQIDLDNIGLENHDTLNSESFKNVQIFYFAPPPNLGTIDTRLQSFLNTIGNSIKRIVLISTTGVYGDSQGEWIDETTQINPKVDRAIRRASAEQFLKNWAVKNNQEYMILRVPGIYAQDRLPLARLEKGLPVVNELEAGWTNRIHADDLALACKAAMECEKPNQTINITDGAPSTMTDYFNQVADFSGISRPPQISMKEAEATLSDGMVSYLKESRRIKNDKMLEELKIKLEYPNLKATFQ